MARPIFLLAVLAACSSGVTLRASAPERRKDELVAIDLFGTQQITLAQMMAAHGDALRSFGERVMRGREEDPMPLLEALDAMGAFADINPSLVGYPRPGGMDYYLTIDFVDRVDAARRMPFAPRPTGVHEDPAGLIADWRAYEAAVLELAPWGRRSARCPAYHCLGDEGRPRLTAMTRRFQVDVPAHLDELATILRDDHDHAHRAAAAYLLAYMKDGAALVRILLPALRDQNGLVRNNAMRVLADIAFFHPQITIPLDPVLEALDYPGALDRNKAAAILEGLLKRPGDSVDRDLVVRRAGKILVRMLRLKQPNNHTFAHRILQSISGESFGDRDYAAWEAWLARRDR